MVFSSAAMTARTDLTSTPEVAARWAARLVLLKASLMGLSAAAGLAGAAFAAAFADVVAAALAAGLATGLMDLGAAFAGADFFAVAIGV